VARDYLTDFELMLLLAIKCNPRGFVDSFHIEPAPGAGVSSLTCTTNRCGDVVRHWAAGRDVEDSCRRSGCFLSGLGPHPPGAPAMRNRRAAVSAEAS
jgi:hypothetical protein